MRKSTYTESEHTREKPQLTIGTSPTAAALPHRLLAAFEVAEFVGCHEETVRRAYLRGLLTSQRFGVRHRRFHPADVADWIRAWRPDTSLVTTSEEKQTARRADGNQTAMQVPQV